MEKFIIDWVLYFVVFNFAIIISASIIKVSGVEHKSKVRLKNGEILLNRIAITAIPVVRTIFIALLLIYPFLLIYKEKISNDDK